MATNEAITAAAATTVEDAITATMNATTPEHWYAVNARPGADEADLRIYGMIGMARDGVNSSAFTKDLAAIKAKQINVHINSDGGSIFEGIAIYNALRNHGARIVTHVDGLAASISSYVAMAGHEIRIARNAYMMIHNPMVSAMMASAGGLRKTAEQLDKLRGQILTTYAERSKRSAEEVGRMMDEETWMDADEAVANGFADFISGEAVRLVANNLSAFGNVPEAIKLQAQAIEEPAPVTASAAAPADEPNNPAPEASLRSEPPSAVPTEAPPMENPTQATPAQTPAAAESGNVVSQGNIQPNFTSVQEAIKHFQNTAGPQAREHGRKSGFEEGAKASRDCLKAIVDVCPGKPQMAVNAFLNGQAPDAVKLAFDEAATVETNARAAATLQDIEIARLNTLLSLGGHPGVAMDITTDTDSPTGMEPKAQAAYEWDRKPAVRTGFTSKENYVNIRIAELNGTFRTQKA